MSTPTRSDGERELASQIRCLWSDMAPGELEKLIAAHVAQRVAEAVGPLEKDRDSLAALVVRLKEPLQDIRTALDNGDAETAWHVMDRQGDKALALVPADLADCVCVERSEWEALTAPIQEYSRNAWSRIMSQFVGAVGKDALDHVCESIAQLRKDSKAASLITAQRDANAETIRFVKEERDSLRTANAALEAENRALRDVVKWSRCFVSEAVDKYGGRLTTGDSAECDLAQETLDNIDAALAPKEGNAP